MNKYKLSNLTLLIYKQYCKHKSKKNIINIYYAFKYKNLQIVSNIVYKVQLTITNLPKGKRVKYYKLH